MTKRKKMVEVTLEDNRRIWLWPDVIEGVRETLLSRQAHGMCSEVFLSTGERIEVREEGNLVVSRIAAAKGELQ